MHIAVLTFEGFHESDAFVVAAILNRLAGRGWQARITAASPTVTSMNGVTVQAQRPLAFAREADAVIVGGGLHSRELSADARMLAELRLDPRRQLIAAQCSGALLLARLGLLAGRSACCDQATRPWLREAGVPVLDEPFVAHGNVATAGGCLAAPYLAAWLLWRCAGEAAARQVLQEVAPVGEKSPWAERIVSRVARCALAGAAG
jgi:transcriptional regulator GlxA family with amidase domain